MDQNEELLKSVTDPTNNSVITHDEIFFEESSTHFSVHERYQEP